jgi:hypothetical protein
VRELLARSRSEAAPAALAAAHAAALPALGPAPLPAPASAAAEGVGPGAELAAAAGALRGGQSEKAAAALETVARLVAVGAATYHELDTSGVVRALSAWLDSAPPAARRAFLSRFLRLDGGRGQQRGVGGLPLGLPGGAAANLRRFRGAATRLPPPRPARAQRGHQQGARVSS